MSRGRGAAVGTSGRLADILDRIDGRGYKAYREIEGEWRYLDFSLFVDRVQSDPFASPSKLRVRVGLEHAGFAADLYGTRTREIALRDYLARAFRRAAQTGSAAQSDGGGSGKSGRVSIDAGGQEVLERSAVILGDGWLEARIEIGFPAAGRRILGRVAEALLLDRLPKIVDASLVAKALDEVELRAFVDCIENQEGVRDQLDARGLVAFVGDGAVLPRESGASDRPLSGAELVPFETPAAYRVEVDLVNPEDRSGGTLSSWVGMGIPKGVGLIVGGGYHGKSTLLNALERAVYPHVPGDGRERVVSVSSLVKVRAEDGRSVEAVDIQAFIGDLPGGRSTRAFSTPDASGSTSQAASILEVVEAGASGLLLDEDTSATNFMLRDARMQQLVAKSHEPITPFVDRVRELYDSFGVSTLIVMGGCGDYFDVADHVLCMRDYRALDATEEAREVARSQPSGRLAEAPEPLRLGIPRRPVSSSLDPARGRRDVKISARGRDELAFGQNDVDLRALEQLVDVSQTRAVGFAIHAAAEYFAGGDATLAEWLDWLEREFDGAGLERLDPFARRGCHPGNFARPRRFEIAGALNRIRRLRVVGREA